jgi:O-acetyl-ADP-ribose deacetylase (regulator of RNase III)
LQYDLKYRKQFGIIAFLGAKNGSNLLEIWRIQLYLSECIMDEVTLETVTLELKQGDIAAQDDIDAVVNAANAQLNGGGGVDGALHGASGPELKKASEPKGPIRPGEAVITPGFNLPNKYVIHCLGPVYGQDRPEAGLLANCYKNALQLAENNGVERIAFPAISCGAFGYPTRDAAKVAFRTIKVQSQALGVVKLIRIVLFDDEAMEIQRKVMEEVF